MDMDDEYEEIRYKKYVDDKIELLNNDLQQLRQAHDSTANQLLKIQQVVVGLKINSVVDVIGGIIHSQLSSDNNLITQLVADAAAAKARIMTSQNSAENSAEIENQFFQKWKGIVVERGAKVINY